MYRKTQRKPLPPVLRAALLLCAACLMAGGFYLAGCAVEPEAEAVWSGEGQLEAVFIDVGQGDAMLLTCGGQHMLVDAGTNQAAQGLVDYLKSRGITRLDWVVATHPHADHIGGMDEVLAAFEVGTFVMPEAAHTTKTFEAMLDALEANGCEARYGAAGDVFTLGTATVTVKAPPGGAFTGDQLNNASLVLSVDYQGTRLLLMGDAEAPVEAALLAEGLEAYHLLKVGHHGSRSSSTEAFIQAVDPWNAVISCGAGNDYGHPHEEVLERLEASQAQLWRTDLNGNITATWVEGVLYVSSER